MAGRYHPPRDRAFDANGVPLPGAKLFFYASGTSTLLDTYSDDDLSVANANPVVADDEGRFGPIFLQGADYKVILMDADEADTIRTDDPVRAPSPKASTVVTKTSTYTVTAANDGELIAADATGGAFTITLLPAATAGDGFEVSVIKIDSSANAVTIDGDGAETINDESDLVLSSQFDSAVLRCDGSEWFATVRPASTATPLPRWYISGLVISNNGTDADHDIDISAGAARDEDDAVNLTLSSTLTKRIDAAWAVGDGNGGLDTGSVANTTWYHVWLIRRSDTGVVDVLFSTSATAPTMPTNYDQKRRIGAVKTDSSANILAFAATETAGGGVQVTWDDPPLDVDTTSLGTTAATETLESVPTGVKVEAITNVGVTNASANVDVYISSLDANDEAISGTAGPLATIRVVVAGALNFLGGFRIMTDTSAQIRIRAGTASTTLRMATLGWLDYRRA